MKCTQELMFYCCLIIRYTQDKFGCYIHYIHFVCVYNNTGDRKVVHTKINVFVNSSCIELLLSATAK